MSELLSGNDKLEVEGFGVRARFRGHDVVFLMLIILLFAVTVFLGYEHDTRSEKRIESIIAAQERLVEEVSALTFVMTLSPDERTKLNIAMPDSLRKKLKPVD